MESLPAQKTFSYSAIPENSFHSSQELLETTVGAQQIGLWSNFGPDQRGRHAARTPFSAMRMPHPYRPTPHRASTYHPAKTDQTDKFLEILPARCHSPLLSSRSWSSQSSALMQYAEPCATRQCFAAERVQRYPDHQCRNRSGRWSCGLGLHAKFEGSFHTTKSLPASVRFARTLDWTGVRSAMQYLPNPDKPPPTCTVLVGLEDARSQRPRKSRPLR